MDTGLPEVLRLARRGVNGWRREVFRQARRGVAPRPPSTVLQSLKAAQAPAVLVEGAEQQRGAQPLLEALLGAWARRRG